MKVSLRFTVHGSQLRRGFTLLELLISISIIGVLAGLLTVNFVGVRQRGRDVQRKSDLKQIGLALEVYRADQGTYLTNFPSCGVPLGQGSSTYLKKIPCDPTSGQSYTYTASADGLTYSIFACLENGNDADIDKDISGVKIMCPSTTLWRYTQTNP